MIAIDSSDEVKAYSLLVALLGLTTTVASITSPTLATDLDKSNVNSLTSIFSSTLGFTSLALSVGLAVLAGVEVVFDPPQLTNVSPNKTIDNNFTLLFFIVFSLWKCFPCDLTLNFHLF